VNWVYTSEEQLANKLQKTKDEMLFTDKNMDISSPESLNFNYKIRKNKNYSWAPVMVFDNGNKTFIKLPKTIHQGNSPILFIKEKGRKDLSLINFRIKDDFYIIDRILDMAELRVSDKEFIQIYRE
jgi:type IV secretion system protein VirB9